MNYQRKESERRNKKTLTPKLKIKNWTMDSCKIKKKLGVWN